MKTANTTRPGKRASNPPAHWIEPCAGAEPDRTEQSSELATHVRRSDERPGKNAWPEKKEQATIASWPLRQPGHFLDDLRQSRKRQQFASWNARLGERMVRA